MWSRATIHATRNLRTGRNARPALSRFYLDVSKRSKRKNAANPIGRGGSIDATFGSSSFPFFITAPTDLSRVYLTTIARTDDYNSTINFASRKILFLSFFDRLRSTCLFFSFFPPLPLLALFYSLIVLRMKNLFSLLSPIARRFCFPARSSKGKKVSTLDRCAAVSILLYRPLFFLLFSAVQKKKKREEKDRRSTIALWSMFRADFSTPLFLEKLS